MTNVTRLKTEAEEAVARQYAVVNAAATGVARDLHAAGFARFEGTGLPHRRVEAYKYTDLKAALRLLNPPAGASPAVTMADVATLGGAFAATAARLFIVDGIYRADLSDIARLPEGVTVTSLNETLANGRTDLVACLSGPEIGHDDPVIALNAALMSDGVVIEVADGVKAALNLHLIHLTTSVTPVATHTRSLVVVGKGAALGMIESIEAADGLQRTDVLNFVVGDNARVEHAIVKADASALDLSTVTAVIDGDANLTSFALVTGGDVTRRQHFVRMQGDGSQLALRGANLLTGRMHNDSTLTVEHDSLDCESRELYRHVVEGEAHGVFQGKVIVRPGAQKTDGKMASNALLLSENAEMDNKPELEIYADDVACGHGATCGEIDERPIFYLMSRGLPRPDAEALLIQSFVGEVVDTVGEGPLAPSGEILRDQLTASIEAWLASRGSRE